VASPPVDLPELALAAFKLLSQPLVIVHGSGEIMAVNDAWVTVALENGNPSLKDCNVGDNYLHACGLGVVPVELIRSVRDGITEVLCGARENFEYEYTCHSPSTERWFVCQAVKILSPHSDCSVLIHSDITEQKRLRDLVRDAYMGHDARRSALGEKSPVVDLTERQREVLEMVSMGSSHKEISVKLGIAQKTVEYHINALKGKFGCSRTTLLIRQATEQGLV